MRASNPRAGRAPCRVLDASTCRTWDDHDVSDRLCRASFQGGREEVARGRFRFDRPSIWSRAKVYGSGDRSP